MSDIISGMTRAGLRLLALSQTGTSIEFTRLKIGDGSVTDETVANLTDLINVIDSINIESTEIIEENNSISLKVTGYIHQINSDYYFRELGLYAIDPDTSEEVLYGYLNKGDEATLIPAVSSDVAVQELVSMIVAIGNATNILVNCENELKIVEQVEGNGGYSLFDIVLKDHILDYDESEGFGLQGTYVYKNAVENEHYGYEDFYNQCLAEKEEATSTRTILDGTTVVTYNNANGHIFYDIADKNIIDTFYNTYGVAWFYGIDEENERIFLPRNNYYFKSSTSGVGEYVAPSLPPITHSHTATANTTGSHTHTRGTMNITGTFRAESQGGGSCTNAFSAVKCKNKVHSGNGGAQENTYTLNAANGWSGETSSDGSHSHTITVAESNANNSLYNGTTVQPPSVKGLLYIVVGNVRPKNGLVINAGLNNAVSKLTNKANELQGDITDTKTSAISDIGTAKNEAIADLQTEAQTQKNLIDTQVETAEDYANDARTQADIARRYAELAVAGQIQADWEENDSTSSAYIQNKPNLSGVVKINSNQTLTNKTLDGNDNTIENLTLSSLSSTALTNDLSDLSKVSAEKLATSLAVYNKIVDSKSEVLNLLETVATSGNYDDLINIPELIGEDSITVTKREDVTVSVSTTNEDLAVSTTYAPEDEEEYNIEYEFSYNGTNWVDESNNIIDFEDYNIELVGTPQENDTITLTIRTVNKYVIAYDDTAIRQAITNLQQAIANIHTFSVERVANLPATGTEKVIYFVPKNGSNDDVHNEYIWVNGAYELIGCTEADFSNYYNKQETDNLLLRKNVVTQTSALTSNNDICSWSFANPLGIEDVDIRVREILTGRTVYPDVVATVNTVTIDFNTSTDIPANKYKAIIIG